MKRPFPYVGETAERLNFGDLVLNLDLRIFTVCRVGRGLLFRRNRKADAFDNDNHKHRCAYAYDRGGVATLPHKNFVDFKPKK